MLVKIKNFCPSKDTITECQVKPQTGEEIYKAFLKKTRNKSTLKNYYESIRMWQISQQNMDKR